MRASRHVLLVLLLSNSILVAQTLKTARVVGVADGDTITVRTSSGETLKVRFFGVDAPEAGQDFSARAKQFTSSLVLGRTVTLRITDHDRYGRTVAKVFVDGTDVGLALTRAGLAWHFTRYSSDRDLAAAEGVARRAHLGLWSRADPIPPWDYRNPKPAPTAPVGPFRGNVDSGVYHSPGCRDYNCRNCTAAFESVVAAESAGYRPHRECVRR